MPTAGGRLKCAEIFLNANTMQRAYNCVFCHVVFGKYIAYADHFLGCSKRRLAEMDIGLAEDPDGGAESPDTANNDANLLFFGDTSPETIYDDPLQMLTMALKFETDVDEPQKDRGLLTCDAASSPQSLLATKNHQSKESLFFVPTPCDKNDEFTCILLTQLRMAQPNQTMLLQCDMCASEHRSRTEMHKHMQRQHIDKERKCTRCGVTFRCQRELRAHKRTHPAERYPCEICGKLFTFATNLTRHLLVHSGKRPFECPECGRKFSQSQSLKSHMALLHGGDLPHKCHLCDRAFVRRCKLARHVDSVHLEIPIERRFQCDLCAKIFKWARTRDIHRRTHTGERPFACDFCDRAFARPSALKVHRNIHTGNTPHQCKHCDRSFHSGAARRSHEKGVHKIDCQK